MDEFIPHSSLGTQASDQRDLQTSHMLCQAMNKKWMRRLKPPCASPP